MSKTNKTKVDLLLEVLSDGEWHCSDELAAKVSLRNHNDVVKKARDRNYDIERRRVGLQHQYRLITS